MKDILIDLDNTVVDFTTPLLDTYNYLYDTQFKNSDIKDYDLGKLLNYKKAQSIWQEFCFFIDLEAYENAIEVLKELSERHRIFIATKPETSSVAQEKYEWVRVNLPFIPFENIIMTSHKWLFKADWMIDDNPNYLEQFRMNKLFSKTVCYDQPYNQDCECDFRVKNWIELRDLFRRIDRVKRD